MHDRPALRLVLTALSLAGFLTGCSSDGGSGTAALQLTNISLLENAVWEVNREIEFTFSMPVDFSTVSLNTINIQATSGAPATGSFFLRDERVVVFQPTCPKEADLSDSGLETGGTSYTLTVVGQNSGAVNTVRSTGGVPLAVTQVRHFTTPASGEPATAFLDTTLGAPVPVLRSAGSSDEDATYLELGGDPDQRVYFERDTNGDLVLSVPGFELPLNLYSQAESAVAVVIEFNQAVNPSASNIDAGRVRLEFLDSLGAWQPLETRVTLEANCTAVGARVRLEPIGILPRESEFRAVVLPGFQDLVGQTNLLAINNFARAPTSAVAFTSLTPADEKSDERHEGFDFGGAGPDSFEDTNALFDSPVAVWGGGELAAAFDFQGAGGPGGDFDWVIGLSFPEVVTFDTTSSVIQGGPGGAPVTTQVALGGIVDVRNLIIRPGSTLRVQGPNPLIVNASGEVRIEGLLDLSGFSAKNVVTINTGDVVEVGGPGAAGGGRGGNANEVVTNSTPRGSAGQGPFGALNAGGQGGETGFAPHSAGKDARRPGGGGGGRFADSSLATAGLAGSLSARGGVTGVSPPFGGPAGVGPFVDDDPQNDLFGQLPVTFGGQLLGLIRGELPSLWAGYGGGGGGNANPSSSFPTPAWTPASDEKGGAGGGGGGGLHIRALGPIVFGLNGTIASNGGLGATGENTLNLDHVGGSGGSGSGGHIVLESASRVDFTDGGLNVNAPLRDWVQARGGPQVTGPPTTGGSVSFGGAGGPGVFQILVPDPLADPGTNPLATDIVVPLQAAVSPDPLDAIATPAGIVTVPTFGSRSQARSEWISIGGADQTPGGPPGLVRFLFGGIETAAGPDEGKILTTGSQVSELPAVFDEPLSASVAVAPDELTLLVSGAGLDDFLNGATSGISSDIYLRTPVLLRDFLLRLVGTGSEDFVVSSAAYDEGVAGLGDEELRVTVAASAAGTLQDFVDGQGGAVQALIIPRFFGVVTGGQEGLLPSTGFVRLRFQAAADDGFGGPDEANPLVDWTADVSQFNLLLPGQLQFFRFEVEFDLDAQSMGVSTNTQPITLDFLRMPFVF